MDQQKSSKLGMLYLNRNWIEQVQHLSALKELKVLILVDNPWRDRICPVQPKTACEF